jgi:hypothetical protein
MLAGHVWLSLSKHGAARIMSVAQIRQAMPKFFPSKTKQIFFDFKKYWKKIIFNLN